MKAVLQRVSSGRVTVAGETVGEIEKGLVVLLGVAEGDDSKDADFLCDKILNLRVFEDEAKKMNQSLLDTGGSLLVVSQFTLLGDCRKGRRPSFIAAAKPEAAQRLYEYFVTRAEETGVYVATGRFGAMMAVSLVNEGPVTLILESSGKS